jgi:hypothetical protein
MISKVLVGTASVAAVVVIGYYIYKKIKEQGIETACNEFQKLEVKEFNIQVVKDWIKSLDLPDFNDSFKLFLAKGNQIPPEVLKFKKVDSKNCMLVYFYNGKKDEILSQTIIVFEMLSLEIEKLMSNDDIIELQSK